MLRFAQRDHLRENVPVMREKKVLGLKSLDAGVQDVVIQDDGAKNGFLSVNIAGQRSFHGGISRHGGGRGLLLMFAFPSLLVAPFPPEGKCGDVLRFSDSLRAEVVKRLCAEATRASIGLLVNREGKPVNNFCARIQED